MAVAAIVIGRNEGARLQACLISLACDVGRVLYVDSGSTDSSVSFARSRGIDVIQLDGAVPFTAARARNAGWRALGDDLDGFTAIQFVDGDCRVEAGWVAMALQALSNDASLGIVTGWRREIDPHASLYNDLCDVEWHRPAGEIVSCGGDMLVRPEVLRLTDGFRDDVIAAEDDEFCVRVRAAGWKIRRLPQTMTWHDAAMTRFGQWWRRAVRSGHGFAQVGYIHPCHFRRERARVVVYGFVLPLVALAGVFVSAGLIAFVALVYAASYARTVQGLMVQGLGWSRSLRHAALLSLSKIPNAVGALTYIWRKLVGNQMRLIEYK